MFPCKGKVPLTGNGCKDATTDTEKLLAWERLWPDANWAIATGSASDRLLVVDVDGIWDEPGDAWTAIANNCGGLPRTVTVLSGSGQSMHWYFRHPGRQHPRQHSRQARSRRRHEMRRGICDLPPFGPPRNTQALRVGRRPMRGGHRADPGTTAPPAAATGIRA